MNVTQTSLELFHESPLPMVTAIAPVRREPPPGHVHEVLRRFCLESPCYVQDFDGKGNIHNDSYLVTTKTQSGDRDYILQRINDTVFTQPWNVMAAMSAAINAQCTSDSRERIPPDVDWHAIELVTTLSGDRYTHFEAGAARGYWRLMVRIPDCLTYKSLSKVDPESRLRLAREAGRGMAIFTSLAASIETAAIVCPLLGYRDTELYFQQFRSLLNGSRSLQEAASFLPADETLRRCTGPLFYVTDPKFISRRLEPEVQSMIQLAADYAGYALTIQRGIESRRIRTTAVHGDTKLENFLFCRSTGCVKALVDLDTIMPHTWLSDWGDMVRSFVNVAGECEPDLNKVRIDEDIFEAVAGGFLSTATSLPSNEIDLMVDAAQIMTLELGVRFLTDYLRGDNYFQLEKGNPSDLNKIRARVQLRLFRLLRQREAALKQCIAILRSRATVAA